MNDTLQQLEVAILHGDAAEVGALLDREPALLDAHFPANVGLTPLMWACRNRRDGIVRALLARGAAVDATNDREPLGDGGNTALWFTAQGAPEGTVGIAAALLDGGAQINARCEHGTTALHMAVSWVHLDLVQFLLARGADPAATDDQGDTPLAMACRWEQWCRAQPTLNADQQKFAERAPRAIRFLEGLAG